MTLEEQWHGSRRHDPSVSRGARPVHQFRSKRFAEDYELISDFETVVDWGSPAGWSDDAVNFKEGSHGMKGTSVNNVAVQADRTISLNANGKHFTFWIYIDDISKLEEVKLYFRSIDGTWNHYFWIYYDGGYFNYSGWSKHEALKSWAAIVGAPDWGDINLVRITTNSKVGETVNVTFDDFRMVRVRFSAKVSLRFDDGILTQYTEARARMDEYGFRGVEAVWVDWVGTFGMSLDQLKHLQERGWDIISHTMSHPNLTTITPAEVENELWNSQRWLVENGFYKGSRFIAPPYYAFNRAVIEQIKKYYIACSTNPRSRAEAIPPNDQYLLKVVNVGDATPVATITGYIDDAIADSAWLTLVFHDVSVAGFPPANFQAVIDYLDANNVEVVTFSDVFDEMIGAEAGYTQLLKYGVQGVITPNATSYPCPGGGLAAQTATEIRVPISRDGWLKNLRVKQRVASGAGGRTDIYTVRVGGVNTDLTCTLDNATEGDDLINCHRVSEGDLVSVKLVSNNVADVSADVLATVELELLM